MKWRYQVPPVGLEWLFNEKNDSIFLLINSIRWMGLTNFPRKLKKAPKLKKETDPNRFLFFKKRRRRAAKRWKQVNFLSRQMARPSTVFRRIFHRPKRAIVVKRRRINFLTEAKKFQRWRWSRPNCPPPEMNESCKNVQVDRLDRWRWLADENEQIWWADVDGDESQLAGSLVGHLPKSGASHNSLHPVHSGNNGQPIGGDNLCDVNCGPIRRWFRPLRQRTRN